MRHALGFLLGILLIPVLAYGMAWGYARAGASVHPLDLTITDRTQFYGAFATMAAVGLFFGIIMMARWASPFVTLFPGIAYLYWSGWYLVEPQKAADLVARVPPSGELDTALQALLTSGFFALAGFALVVPMWFPARWRRRYEY
ncbi:hypothetical protein LO762_30280 [Actinocorallia sp. API 0066]|uniref:hypothetical protein n=1 Tax=Actinocorallia sp. API 0066 TaxID=2896846 RepID=UPI001E31FC38|nr:hypothetical protein [Actinocorallia sp. API 0066]MCD0453438.1 hypothetical protein [Actinocorallia sp. API 0066]